MPDQPPADPATPADPAAPPADPNTPPADPAGDEPLGEPGKKALEAERARADDAAKENKRLLRELDAERKKGLTAEEKVLEEAREAGRSEVRQATGLRLARTEFDAAAGRRNPEAKVADILEFVDLAKFVGDDGEPDVKRIGEAVAKLVPAVEGTPSFDQGTRQTVATGGMNDFIRKAAGR
jgi:hypothetical protein